MNKYVNACTRIHCIRIPEDRWSLSVSLTHCCSEPYFEKEKMGTGSGTTLLCGFRLAQTRAARAERHRQESQTCVADLATLFLDPDAFQTLHKTTVLKHLWRCGPDCSRSTTGLRMSCLCTRSGHHKTQSVG